EASMELIDLRSISPWDRETVEESVRKTGRVIIIQEDTENCSVGQMIIAHLMSQTDLWSKMVSPPILVSKGNVMIGYNPIYEYAALPDVQKIVAAIRKSISTKPKRTVGAAVPAAESDDGGRRARPYSGREPQPRPATDSGKAAASDRGYNKRSCAFPDHHPQTQPRHSRQPANRRALGCYSQGARRGEKEKRPERPIAIGHDGVGGCARDGKTCAISSFGFGG